MTEYTHIQISKECFESLKKLRASPQIEEELKLSWSAFLIGLTKHLFEEMGEEFNIPQEVAKEEPQEEPKEPQESFLR